MSRIKLTTTILIVIVLTVYMKAIVSYGENPYYNWTSRSINPELVNKTADPVYIASLIASSISCYLKNRSGYEQISTLQKENTSIPRALEDRIISFTTLLNETYNHLLAAEKLVSESKILVKTGDFEEAISKLREAGVEIAKANVTAEELLREWVLLKQQLSKYSSESVKPILQEYYTFISKLLKDLKSLLNEITTLSIQCYARASGELLSKSMGKGLVNTTIIVYNYSRIVYPNSTFTVTGRVLEAGGETGVSGGVIHLIIVAKYYVLAISNATVNSSGFFKARARVAPVYPLASEVLKPGIYKFQALVSIYYMPVNKSVFRGCYKTLNTTLEYIVPELKISGTSVSMPGLNCTYTVKYPVRAGYSIITVRVFGLNMKYKLPPGGGRVTFRVPSWVKPGFYSVEFTFLEHGFWYKSIMYHPLEIKLEDYIVSMKHSDVIVYPFQKLVVKGVVKLLNGTPVQGAIISAGGFKVESGVDGSFTLRVPVKPWFNPVVSINLTINTTKPWNPVKKYVISTRVLNTPLITASIILIALVTAYPLPPKRGVLIENVEVSVKRVVKREERVKATSIAQWVVSSGEVYKSLVNLLARISPPLDSETIREYFSRISKLRPEISGVLASVQPVIEYALYSGAGFTSEVQSTLLKAIEEVKNILGGALEE